MEHSQHGSKAMLWLEPELQRVLGFTGKEATPVEIRVRPYMCVICDKAVAMPTLAPDEKKSMGAEWLVNEHSHIEIGGILICRNCWPRHPKLRIDSYRVSGVQQKDVTVPGMVVTAGFVWYVALRTGH